MKNIKYVLLGLIALIFVGCSNKEIDEEINKPKFDLIAFQKVQEENIFICEATIRVSGTIFCPLEDFCIDGLLYNDSILNLDIKADSPYVINTNVVRKDNFKSLLTITGKLTGVMTINIKFITTQSLSKYLVGWHLAYGFTNDCQLLMINLNIK